MSINATVCIFTNMTSASRGVELLPEPAKLRADEGRSEKSRKTKKLTGGSADLKAANLQNVVVEFPDKVSVLQNASDFARVVEPVPSVGDTKIK